MMLFFNLFHMFQFERRHERERRPNASWLFSGLVISFWSDGVSHNHWQLLSHCRAYEKEATTQAHKLFSPLFSGSRHDSWGVFSPNVYLPANLLLEEWIYYSVDNFEHRKST